MEVCDVIDSDVPVHEGSPSNFIQYLGDCYLRIGLHEKRFSRKCNTTAARLLLQIINDEQEGSIFDGSRRTALEVLNDLCE